MLFLQDINQNELTKSKDIATNIVKCCKVQKKLTNIKMLFFSKNVCETILTPMVNVVTMETINLRIHKMSVSKLTNLLIEEGI